MRDFHLTYEGENTVNAGLHEKRDIFIKGKEECWADPDAVMRTHGVQMGKVLPMCIVSNFK